MSNKNKGQPQGADVADLNAAKAQVAELQAKNDKLQKQLEALRAQKSGEQTSPHAGKGSHIRVAAVSDDYWRGGIAFSRQPKELALDELTGAQLAAIRADARLVVVDL